MPMKMRSGSSGKNEDKQNGHTSAQYQLRFISERQRNENI